jgi:hypothetical protein
MERAVIKGAPWHFAVAVFVGAALCAMGLYGIFTWRYGAQIETRDAVIAKQANDLIGYRQKEQLAAGKPADALTPVPQQAPPAANAVVFEPPPPPKSYSQSDKERLTSLLVSVAEILAKTVQPGLDHVMQFLGMRTAGNMFVNDPDKFIGELNAAKDDLGNAQAALIKLASDNVYYVDELSEIVGDLSPLDVLNKKLQSHSSALESLKTFSPAERSAVRGLLVESQSGIVDGNDAARQWAVACYERIEAMKKTLYVVR